MGASTDGICQIDDLTIPTSSHATLHCFTPAESLGLAFGAGAGFLSLFSVIWLFVLIARNTYRAQRAGIHQKKGLIQKPMDVYLLSLFFGELLHGLGVTLEFKWINDGKVSSGTLCSAQGMLMNVGSVTIALFTLVIAWYTFITVWWAKRMTSLTTPYVASLALWIYAFLYASVFISTQKHPTHRYYLPTPYWCWISQHFTYNRAAGEWFWLWFALFFCLLFYVLLAIRSRRSAFRSTWDNTSSLQGIASPFPSATKRISHTMMLYALSYCILVLPMSVARWIQYALEARGKPSHVPPIATITVFSIFNLGGVVNVVLFFITRSGLLLFDNTTLPLARPRETPPFVRACDSERATNDDDSEAGTGTDTIRLGSLPTRERNEHVE